MPSSSLTVEKSLTSLQPISPKLCNSYQKYTSVCDSQAEIKGIFCLRVILLPCRSTRMISVKESKLMWACEESLPCWDSLACPSQSATSKGDICVMNTETRIKLSWKSRVGGMDGGRMKEGRRWCHTNPHIQKAECRKKQEPSRGYRCFAVCLHVCNIRNNKGSSMHVAL